MFRTFIVLRGLVNPRRLQHRPNKGPKRAPKSAQITFQIDPGSPFYGFYVGRPRKIDLGPIWNPSWGHLGPISGPSWAILGSSWAILGPSWAYLGPSWGLLEQ